MAYFYSHFTSISLRLFGSYQQYMPFVCINYKDMKPEQTPSVLSMLHHRSVQVKPCDCENNCRVSASSYICREPQLKLSVQLTGGEICNATFLFLSLRVRPWRTHLPRHREALVLTYFSLPHIVTQPKGPIVYQFPQP